MAQKILYFLITIYLVALFLKGEFLAKNKGETFECEDCGLVVVVENPCECDESCALICCQEPMKPVKNEDKESE